MQEGPIDLALRGAFEHMRTGVAVRDAEGRIVLVNDALCTLLGFSRDELLRSSDILDVVAFDEQLETPERDRAHVGGEIPEVVSRTGQVLRRDGSEIYVSISHVPLSLHDGSLGSLVEVSDVIADRDSARTASEVSSILDTAPNAIVLVDERGAIVRASRAVRQIFGWDPEELLGRSVSVLIGGAAHDRHGAHIERYLAGDAKSTPGGSILQVSHDATGRRKNGTEFPVEVVMAEARDTPGARSFIAVIRDASAQTEAARLLLESQEHYRAIFEDSLTPLVLIRNADGQYVERNDAFADMLGYSSDEISGLPQAAFMLPADVEAADKRLKKLLDGDGTKRDPYVRRYIHKAGHTVEVVIQESQLQVGEERIGILFSVRDVTTELAALKESIQSEARFRGAFETSAIGMSMMNGDGETILRNEAFAKMLGYTAAEFADVPYDAFTRQEDADDATTRMSQILSGGPTPPPIRRQYQHRDGHWVDIVRQAEPLDIDGERVGFVATIRDVSEQLAGQRALQASEDDYRTLFETAPNGQVVVGHDRRLRFANGAAIRLLGYERDDLVGMDCSDLVHEDEREEAEQALGQLMNPPTGPDLAAKRAWTRRFVTSGGEVVTVDVIASLYREAGEVTGVHLQWTDLTETMKLRDELLRSQKLEAIGTLVAGVAHDFNNLLTAIGGSVELAAAETGSSPWLDRAAAATDRASDLVQQLLRFSRETDGSHERVDLGNLTEEVVTLIEATIDRRIAVQVERPNTGPYISTDITQMHQLLMNLIINARDAVSERLDDPTSDARYEPKIIVSISTIDEPDRAVSSGAERWIELRVSDNGIGMTPAVVARIFDPFFTTKESGEGTGLGLSTVYGIVRDHGGSVAVESTPGSGSIFVVRLPSGNAKAPKSVDEATGRTGGTGRILIVDDETVIREILDGVLGAAGYEVVSALGGREALRMADEQRFDLVLLDINLPSLGGWDVLAELRRKDADLPVIVVSGYAQQTDVEERGARGFLQKPFDSSALLAVVGEHIRTT